MVSGARAALTAVVTRFAPSPTGLLHLGHAYSALTAWEAAEGGGFLVRIEDIDPTRCRSVYEAAILDDLAWLGLSWPTPVRRQSECMGDYRAALDRLAEGGLVYPCFCTRTDIAAAGSAPHGPDGPVYSGTCRNLSADERAARIGVGEAYAMRLDMTKAVAVVPPLVWTDRRAGEIFARPETFGDVVLARKETPASYHLAVVVDDHLQGVTLVVRGEDLFPSTHVHRLLQALLGYPAPLYGHHRLIVDETGRRLAKRDRAVTLASMREGGATPDDIRRRLGFGTTGGGG
jgi:glutamyl-Q tRNA(Asp) synthetase